MVSFRNRSKANGSNGSIPPVEPSGGFPSPEGARSAEGAGARVINGAGSADNVALAPPSNESALRDLLAAQDRAEQYQRDFQKQLASQMLPDAPQPEPPKLSERDLEFIGARPGIDKDPRLGHAAVSLEQLGIRWGTDRFYETLGSMFPLSDYRRVEPEPKPTGEPVQLATEAPSPAVPATPAPQVERVGPVTSAPVSREAPSLSSAGYRPSASAIKLSPDQRQIAWNARPDLPRDQAERLYARGVVELQRRKHAGLVQDDQ